MTTPVVSSIVNRPFASSSSVYITESVASASFASASSPTDDPAARFSATEFVVASMSLMGETSNSSTSVMSTVTDCESVPVAPSLTVISTS